MFSTSSARDGSFGFATAEARALADLPRRGAFRLITPLAPLQSFPRGRVRSGKAPSRRRMEGSRIDRRDGVGGC